MADPIPTAIETLKILIDQVPYYAQTPQGQEVIGLIAGVILVGQDLINAAAIQAQISQILRLL